MFEFEMDLIDFTKKAKDNDGLTHEQIQLVMNNGLNGNEENLVAYWNFNEGSGTTVTDQSGNGNDGTVYGATWVDSNEERVEEATTRVGEALDDETTFDKEKARKAIVELTYYERIRKEIIERL